MGMFGKLKGKDRGKGASEELVEDIEGLTAMAAEVETGDPEVSLPEGAAAVQTPAVAAVAGVGGGNSGPAGQAGDDDSPLDDNLLSIFEEEEDFGDPLVRDMVAEVENMDAEELLSEILSVTEEFESA